MFNPLLVFADALTGCTSTGLDASWPLASPCPAGVNPVPRTHTTDSLHLCQLGANLTSLDGRRNGGSGRASVPPDVTAGGGKAGLRHRGSGRISGPGCWGAGYHGGAPGRLPTRCAVSCEEGLIRIRTCLVRSGRVVPREGWEPPWHAGNMQGRRGVDSVGMEENVVATVRACVHGTRTSVSTLRRTWEARRPGGPEGPGQVQVFKDRAPSQTPDAGKWGRLKA